MKVFVVLASVLVVSLAQAPHGPNPEEMFPDQPRPAHCPEPMCTTRCTYGLKKNAQGCETCECNPSPCEGHDCSGNQVCIVSYENCMMDVACFGHPKCVDPKPCSNVMCMMACPNGMKVDAFGCEICECKDDEPEPPKKDPLNCGEVTCMEGQHCTEVMGEKKCTVRPWCHRMKDFYRDLLNLRNMNKPEPEPPVPGMMMHHDPQCDHDGSFKPRQCHEKHCWCVHENGTEIEGTRNLEAVNAEFSGEHDDDDDDDDNQSKCERKKMVSAHLRFHMRHNIDDVDKHVDRIRSLMHEHMIKWMTIRREDIIQINVQTHEVHILQIEVVVIHSGRTDLSSALMHFHEHFTKQHMNVKVEPGKTLEPVPASCKIERQYQQKPVTCWGRFKTFYHHHPVAVISGTVAAGLLLLLAILVTCMACCCKKARSRQRYEIKNYDKNLSFANQLYNYPEVVTGDLEKAVLSEKEKEALA